VWEASKFWKQFFEASANVSLSGYEELAADDEDETATAEGETTIHDDSTADYTSRHGGDDNVTASSAGGAYHHQPEDSLLDDDGDLTGSTPRPPNTRTIKPQFADLQSPYEALKREMQGEESRGGVGDDGDEEEEDSTVLLQQHTARLPDMSMTPRSSLAPEQFDKESTAKRAKDPLLHRILDKTYRLQATPHKTAKPTSKAPPLPWQDSPTSSPVMEVPRLRSEAFMSPVRPTAIAAARQRLASAAAVAGPRTPGVSVQTPATGRKTRDVFKPSEDATATRQKSKYEIDWESDSDEDSGKLYGGMSPPKTIQFALPPSKLLQTPGRPLPPCYSVCQSQVSVTHTPAAREASKRIVEDILLTAGAAPDESEYSPTMVKMNDDILNESF
jgi:DASH complex subunit ASK1